MKKDDLQKVAGISRASVIKLSKGESVEMKILMKVCHALGYKNGDIMDFIIEPPASLSDTKQAWTI